MDRPKRVEMEPKKMLFPRLLTEIAMVKNCTYKNVSVIGNGNTTICFIFLVDASEPVCPVKRKSGVTKDGDKEDEVPTPEKKAKKDDESEVVEKETASA